MKHNITKIFEKIIDNNHNNALNETYMNFTYFTRRWHQEEEENLYRIPFGWQ